jgi:hypothetical protein
MCEGSSSSSSDRDTDVRRDILLVLEAGREDGALDETALDEAAFEDTALEDEAFLDAAAVAFNLVGF